MNFSPATPVNTVDNKSQISPTRPMTYEAAIRKLMIRVDRDIPMLRNWPEIIELQRMHDEAAQAQQTAKAGVRAVQRSASFNPRNKLEWTKLPNEARLTKDAWEAQYGGHTFRVERGINGYNLFVDNTMKNAHATLIGAQQHCELLID